MCYCMQKIDPAPAELWPAGYPAEEFAARRAKVFDAVGPAAAALLQGAGPVRASERFRQSNEFFHLCGVEVPQAFLLLDGRRRRTTLFLPPRDERHARVNGETLTADSGAGGAQLTGVDEILPSAGLAAALQGLPVVYVPKAPAEGRWTSRDGALKAASLVAADPWDGAPSREERFAEAVRRLGGVADVRDLSPILDRIRMVKSPRERAWLRQAGRLSGLAVRRAMAVTEPGLSTRRLEAEMEFLYREGGASGEGYAPLIPAGEHVWHAHWCRNDEKLVAGDWVLFDCAPEVNYMTSDIGRLWPVDGRYRPWQRELYSFMVDYHKTLLRLIRPGRFAGDILEEAASSMKQVVESRSWSCPDFAEAARATLTYQGHLSHPVGMAVHDPGDYFKAPLEPGVTFAVDPQLWVHGRKLYVRVEDTVIVTEDGIENLTREAPLELDEVEALVGRA